MAMKIITHLVRNILLTCFTFKFVMAQNHSEIYPSLTIFYEDGSNMGLVFNSSKPILPYAKIWSVCSEGVWIFYSGEHYSIGEETGIIQIRPKLVQFNCPVSLEIIRSARIAGFLPDNALPSVSLFSQSNFRGEMTVFGDKIPDIKNAIESFITISPKSGLRLFEKVNYEGYSACIYGNYGVGDVRWAYNWELYNIPWNAFLAKSAKLGCS